nr:MAG TPA: crystallin beta/gamma motif-containing protein [Caudoviricetes sp.]
MNKITPEQATNGTFEIKSNANVGFVGGIQQEVTDNSYSKAIGNAVSGIGDWIIKNPSNVTVAVNTMNALTQTDVTPQQSEILQPVMHRAEQIYLWNKADWAQSAQDSGNALGISPDIIMASGQDGIRRAEAAAAQINRGKTINEVYELYPELIGINYKSSAEAITTLQNLQSAKATRGIFDSIQQSVWAMNDQIKLGNVGFELAHTTDKDRIKELTDEMERLQGNLQQYRKADALDSPLQAIIGDTTAQTYMMGKHGGRGAIIGGIVGGVIGGVATEGVGIAAGAATGAKWGGGADMAYNMYKMSFGNKYLELVNKRDAQGNRVYSNDEAYKYAMSFAAVDTGIELVSTRFMGKAVGKVAPASIMSKSLQGATSNTIKTFDRGIGATVGQMAKTSLKAGGSELVEEGLQDVNEKVQHNLYRNANDLEDAYSASDIALGAGGAMLQALPAVIGLGTLGGGVSGVHTMKAFHEFTKLTPEQQQQAVMAEQNRNGHAIMQSLKQDASSNQIAKENPELYGKIVQAQGDKVGVSTAYVNVNEMAETEEGQQAIKNMIDSGLVTQEEVSKSIEADADIAVPIGKYAQLSGGLTEETVKALEESTYFTRGGMSMKTLERAKAEVEAFNNNLVDATEKKAQRVKESIIRDEFEDASDVDREVLDQVFANPTQVKQAYNNLYKNLVQEYRETYASDFDNMDNDIKEATASGVEPQWLTDYKSNSGGKAPRTNAERRRAAYHSSVAKAQTVFADNAEALNQSNIHHADMEHTLQQIESLERLHDKIFTLADNDIALRMQLSKSGYEVYNKVVKAIGESTDRKQRETAKANALLMAQHADVMAQYMRQMGKGGYTAMDYLRDSVRIKMDAVLEDQKGYNQLNQGARLKLSIDKKKWSRIIDNISSYKRDDLIRVMDTPAVLQLVGVKDLPIKMYVSKYFDMKTGAGKNNQHKTVTNKMWKQLPSALVDPIAIFPSKTVNGSIVIMTEITDSNKKQSVVALELSTNVAKNITINRIKSFYPKDNASANTWFYNNFADKNNPPLYINEQKTTRWFTRRGLQLPYQVNQSSGYFNKSIPNEKDLSNYRNANSNIFYQSAWHGSPHDFDEFDLGAIGTGEGNQVHGWGLYFAKDKKVSDLYRRELSLIHDVDKGTLFKVDVPDTKTMIDEQQSLNILSKETKQNLNAAINALPEQEKEVFINEYTNSPLFNHYAKKRIDELKSDFDRLDTEYDLLKNKYLDEYIEGELNTIAQRNINRLAEKYNIDLKALKENPNSIKDIKNQLDTMWFNAFKETGMAGKKYREVYWGKYKNDFSTLLNDGGINGRDFYTALSKALGGAKQASEHLNKYGVKGITYIGEQDGRCYVVFDDKAIKVIEKYNQSINGMTEIMKDGERIISIFKTADRSTFLHEMGHVFFDDIQKLASMDNAPKQLLDDWNTLKEWSGWVDGDNVDNTKAHEKFARGWESYLRSGEAPTKGLQRVFRQFSKWLTRIYRSVQRLGGEVPSDIKDIMARMIATQDDIENYAHEQALEQFENTKLYQQLSETEQARVQGYIADIKGKAKERVMRKYMKELDNRPIKEWEEVKYDVQVAIEKRLIEEYPIYKEHQRYMALGDGALENTQYRTIEGLEKAEREEAGSTYDEAVAQEMERAKDAFINDPNAGKSNQEIAEEMLLSNQGQMELTQEEARLIKAHTNKELAKNWELLSKLQKLDPSSENLDEELKPIEKELTNDAVKVSKELASTAKELDTAQDKIESLKAQLQERIDAVRAIRDGGFGTIPKYMERAKRELGDLTLSQASQYKKYQNQAVRDGKKADSALAVGKVDEALYAKQSQMLNQARARVAFENSKAIKKLRTKLLDQLGRITRSQNPIMIEPNMRYFYTHMAYQMGLTKYDGLKPVDGFDMISVIKALDADADIMGDKEATVQLEDWVKEMFNAQEPASFASLKMSQLLALEELMTGMYKNGRTQYEGTTLIDESGNNVTFDDAISQIIETASATFGRDNGNVFNELNNRSKVDALSNKINDFHLSLLKVETFLRRLDGGKNGVAVRYIYDPIDKATRKFNEYKEKSMYRLARDVKAVYSKKQLFDVRNDHLYNVGELRNVTKEQIIMLALNWGTPKNRQRALETIQSNEVEMERAFQEYMTDKDWEFVIRTWEHINSFYEERSKVQEELYGNPLNKEKGITFTIGGREIQGQYFPIVYNPKVSAKVSDFETEDIAKTMIASNAIFGTGMGATKPRLDVVKGKSLMLDFDVIPNAITEAINHVTMRKAVTDVNKLIGNSRFQEYIVDKFGMETYQFLRTWVRDNWKDEAAKLDAWGRLVMTLKKNTSTAVMAGRVSVALQNAFNFPVSVYRIGLGNTLKAISNAGAGFYGHGTSTYNATLKFVFGKSIFMRERVQTLDKDLKQGLSIGGKGFRIGDTNIGGYKLEQLGEVRDDINQMGFRLLTETDFALSIPVWKFAYDKKILELQSKEGVTAEFVEQEAISAGDRAVRDIFGSGYTKDSAGIQRSRNALSQLFIPFYSYANTLYNILAEGSYALKDQKNYGQFVRMLWWTLAAQALGMMAYKAMTNGDDDSPEDLVKSFIEELVSQSIMGVPFVRDAANITMRNILGEKSFGKTNSVIATSIVDKLQDIYTAINSKNKDATDVGRSLSQVSNRLTGFSDTVTDGLWTLAKFALTDTDAKLEDVIMAIILDKKLRDKKSNKKDKH